MDNPVDQHTARSRMRRAAQYLVLFTLMPVIMLTGLVLVNAAGKHEMKAFATYQGAAADAAKLCVVEDFQKFSLVIMGAFAGTICGIIFRAEQDLEFSKVNYIRRVGYMTVALLTSVCATPYFLMKISDDQPKALCLIMGAAVAAFAWLILEIFYSKVKAYASWLLDRFIPMPTIKGVDSEKDKKPPTA